MCVIHTWSVVGRWGFWSDGSSLGIPFLQGAGGTVQLEASPERFVLLALTGTTGGLGHQHSDHNQPPFLQCQNAQCLRQCMRTDKGTSKNNHSKAEQTMPMYFCISRVGRLSKIDCYGVILEKSKGNYGLEPVRIESSSLSDPAWRAIVMADRRSPWADLRFLAKHSKRVTDQNMPLQNNKLTKKRTYLIRRLDLVGSACSISVFLWENTFLIVFASFRKIKMSVI